MGQTTNAGILGVGMYLPERVLTNKELEKMVDTNEEWILSRTGISERRIAAPEEATSDLALAAGAMALEDAGVKPDDLGLIIVATNTPDTIMPATACLVQDRLGASRAGAFDLVAGCTGFMCALSVACQFINSGAMKYVLVIGAEVLSRIVDWQDRNTCVIFGDGAGAVLLGPVPRDRGILATRMGSDGSGGPHLWIPGGGSRMPVSSESLEQRQHFIKMNGREVFKFAVKAMGEGSLEVMEAAGIEKEQLDFLVPHQANTRIIDLAAKKLNLPMDKVQVNVNLYGNTSTGTVPIALCEAVRQGKLKDGDNVVLVGFGGGLTWAAAAMRWYDKGGKPHYSD